MTEDKVVGWHHQLNEHEFEQIPRDGEGQRCLACCSPWGFEELDMTAQRAVCQLQNPWLLLVLFRVLCLKIGCLFIEKTLLCFSPKPLLPTFIIGCPVWAKD